MSVQMYATKLKAMRQPTTNEAYTT